MTYQDVQRAQAQEIMESGIHGSKDQDEGADTHMGKIGSLDLSDDPGLEKQRRALIRSGSSKPRENPREQAESQNTDSVAKNAMFDTPNVVDEEWEGDLENEVDNWIQEEFYIHGKI